MMMMVALWSSPTGRRPSLTCDGEVQEMADRWQEANDATMGDCSLCGNTGYYSLHGDNWEPTGESAFCDCVAAVTMPPVLRRELVACGLVLPEVAS